MFEIFFALGAGIVSFLSPCVLPLIPGYIAYISGSTLNEILEKKNINILPIILFTLGFSIVFVIFGAAASYIGQLLLIEMRHHSFLFVLCVLDLYGSFSS